MVRGSFAACALAALYGAASTQTAAAKSLEEWTAQELQLHEQFAVTSVTTPFVGDDALPTGCNYTVFNSTSTVLCIVNDNSPVYNPISVAHNVSLVPGIEALSFAVDVAPVGGPLLDDAGLAEVAANLNSTSVTSLHVFVGALAMVSDEGITTFTSLNPTVSLTLHTTLHTLLPRLGAHSAVPCGVVLVSRRKGS